ncbi:hypothetical protein [Aquimarina algicola]|uniref:Uncharacterized protein n=1 Tax=Aquimarina algicola TaxID=2589995 RepID=A0A504JLN9_9FLAO|nr:hypothetical protein [Aquimarina algicola]TPN87679.1 hypothetical protein FHK87_08875 [Aquimarina algicola]
MLKSKKSLYILLPLVVFIWGAIIFQVLGAFSDDDPIFNENTQIDVSEITTKEREVFTIEPLERDPFLGTLYQPKKKKSKSTKPRVQKQTAFLWPNIQYKGLVSGNNNNAIYLISINGVDQLMKVKQTIDQVTLIKGASSTIRLKYKGKTKNFTIAN